MSNSITYSSSNIDTSILHFQGPYSARITGDGEFISSDSSETGSIYYTHHRLPAGKNIINALDSSKRPQIIIQYNINIPDSVIYLTEGFLQISSGSLLVR